MPRQQRGLKRVDGLLSAAACVIAEVGYEAATMSAIAVRADSAIGSLYQFFPNKEAVVEALRARYVKEIEMVWAALAAEVRSLKPEQLVSRIVQLQIEFAEDHPAFLVLITAPPTTNSARRREIIRGRIAQVILRRKPNMVRSEAFRLAAVVQQTIKGLLTLYAQSDKREKSAILDEFKALLTGYLAPKLGS